PGENGRGASGHGQERSASHARTNLAMISNASELLWCRTCGTRLVTYIRATTPDRVRLQHGWRRMQAKAVRVDTQLWGGRRDLARQALQGKQFLTCSWGPQRNPIGARAACRDRSAPSVAVSAR